MQRIIVDLPEPDGPHTTTRSAFLTSRLMSVRTWNSPNHLSTWRSSMIGWPARVSVAVSVMSPPPPLIELALEHLAVARHEKAEGEVNRRSEDIGFEVEAVPIGVGQCRVGG